MLRLWLEFVGVGLEAFRVSGSRNESSANPKPFKPLNPKPGLVLRVWSAVVSGGSLTCQAFERDFQVPNTKPGVQFFAGSYC